MKSPRFLLTATALSLALASCANVQTVPLPDTADDDCPSSFSGVLADGTFHDAPPQQEQQYSGYIFSEGWPLPPTPVPSCFFASDEGAEQWWTLAYRAADAASAQVLFDELGAHIREQKFFLATDFSESGLVLENYLDTSNPEKPRQVVTRVVTGEARLAQYVLEANQPVVIVTVKASS